MSEPHFIGGIRFEPPARANPGSPQPVDPVNKPAHYNVGSIECIAAIRAAMAPDEFRGYCKGNAMKYIWRERWKGHPNEDLQKAIWYLNEALEHG